MGLPNSKRRLSVQDIDYLKNNTKFNEKEIKKWYKGFMVSGAVGARTRAPAVPFQKECKSGQLTKEQFLEVYKSLFPNGDAEKFCLHGKLCRSFHSRRHSGHGIGVLNALGAT